MKRIFDILLALAGMMFFTPTALIFSLLIKKGDGGPIFYRQERWGRGGKRFTAFKFRTMVVAAGEDGQLKPAEENDQRVTRIGRFLRDTAMDELPQLINILKGDMSFVGPRALAVSELDPLTPGFKERHQIRPGLTGPAQVFAPKDASFEEKFRYDLGYVRNHAFPGDLRILFLSLWITLRGKWESRKKKI